MLGWECKTWFETERGGMMVGEGDKWQMKGCRKGVRGWGSEKGKGKGRDEEGRKRGRGKIGWQ